MEVLPILADPTDPAAVGYLADLMTPQPQYLDANCGHGLTQSLASPHPGPGEYDTVPSTSALTDVIPQAWPDDRFDVI